MEADGVGAPLRVQLRQERADMSGTGALGTTLFLHDNLMSLWKVSHGEQSHLNEVTELLGSGDIFQQQFCHTNAPLLLVFV